MQSAAHDLGRYGSEAVLLKGGHLEESDSSDLLYLCRENRFVALAAERVTSRNTHGTGCTLSAAIAARLAWGQPVGEAVRGAKDYLTEGLRRAHAVGKGRGCVGHHLVVAPGPAIR